MHDVVLSSPTDGQFLRYNSASTVWVNDAINLGTDTVGNYMSDLTQGTGITITHTPSEGSNATIAIGQDVGTSASVTFADINATGDLVVSGNLTVNGTTTTLNTETLEIEDNIVVFNSNVTGSPTLNAGIEVERGTSANVSLRWNESSGKWEITEDGTAYLEIATTSDVSALVIPGLDDIGDVSASAAVSGDYLKYNGAAWVNDPINLGTDTIGDYVQNLTAGTGVTLANNSGESATPSVAIGQDVSASASVAFANVTSTGNVSISGRIDKTTIRESVADASVSASVVTADYSTGDIFYIGTAPNSNFTVNLTNAPTDNGKAITVVLFVTQGATGYYPSVVQVAGSAQTIKWANGAAPTPTSSAGKIDIFSFTFVRRSSAWTVFGSSNLGY
jgi:hypothetical protein